MKSVKNLTVNKRHSYRISILIGCLLAFSAEAAQWSHFGQDRTNARHQKSEDILNAANVNQLVEKWSTSLADEIGADSDDVWTTPAVDESAVYFPDSAGYLWALDRETGAVLWRRTIAEYTGKFADFSRTTPAIAGNKLIIGNQANRYPFGADGNLTDVGALVIAVDKNTGDRIWVTEVDDHHFSIITQAATVFGNTVLVGVSSYESAWAFYAFPPPGGGPALGPDYQETSRGSMLALDKNTGAIKWRTYTTTSEFSGASIWGSAPSIDVRRGQVFVGTGQNFSMPEDVEACAATFFEGVDPFDRPAVDAASEAARGCLDDYPNNHFDSILAFDLNTGEINWSNKIVGYDTWHVACLIPGLNELFCPNPSGNDADFGQAPIFFTVGTGGNQGGMRDLVGVGQKSGVYWALDAETGETVWSTKVSPGGFAGGIQWGSSYDGERIYTSSANSDAASHTLIDGTVTSAGIFSALNPATGEILWQTANPSGGAAGGAVSSANGVVYACSLDPQGMMYALDGASGAVLWAFASGGSCNSGAAIADGTVFWGSGYPTLLTPLTPGDKFRAFSLPE